MSDQSEVPTNPNLSLVTREDDESGAIDRALRKAFGRSYRTTLAGLASLVCGGIVAVGTAAPGVIPPQVLTIAIALGPLFGGAGLMVAKDGQVSGRP